MSNFLSWQVEMGLERSCAACDNPRAVAAADVAAEGEAQSDAVAGDGQAEDGSGAHEDNGKPAESRPVLNSDTAGTFSILQLLDFWGCDAVMGQKSHDGTLEDAAEADLKVGEKVLLIASEECPYSEGMLCYRHLCTVLLVASEDDFVHFDQVKLRFVKWPLPKYDIWIHKRHWHIERVTPERLKEHKEYNKQYEKVKKWVASESKRRQLKRQRQAQPSDQEDADSSSDSEQKSGAKPQGRALQPPKSSHAAEPDLCYGCKKKLPLSEFSYSQRKRSGDGRKCMDCLRPYYASLNLPFSTDLCCMCKRSLPVSQFKFAAKDQKNVVCLTCTATQIHNECGPGGSSKSEHATNPV